MNAKKSGLLDPVLQEKRKRQAGMNAGRHANRYYLPCCFLSRLTVTQLNLECTLLIIVS